MDATDDLFVRIRSEKAEIDGRPCSKCRRPRDISGQRYCRECKNAYSRAWKKTHPLTGEARKKAIARSYTKVYVKRGKLEKLPCERCGSASSEAHHHDYDKPLDVTWLCRPCHMWEHRHAE